MFVTLSVWIGMDLYDFWIVFDAIAAYVIPAMGVLDSTIFLASGYDITCFVCTGWISCSSLYFSHIFEQEGWFSSQLTQRFDLLQPTLSWPTALHWLQVTLPWQEVYEYLKR